MPMCIGTGMKAVHRACDTYLCPQPGWYLLPWHGVQPGALPGQPVGAHEGVIPQDVHSMCTACGGWWLAHKRGAGATAKEERKLVLS